MQTCGVDYRTRLPGRRHRRARGQPAGLRGIDLDGRDARRGRAASTTGRPLGLADRDLTEVLDPRPSSRPATAAGGAAPRGRRGAWPTSCSRRPATGAGRDRAGRCGSRLRATLEAALRRRRRPQVAGGGAVTTARPAHRRRPSEVAVVNVGLPLFADAVAEQGRPVVQVDWRIPAGGDPRSLAALRRLFGPRCRAGRRGQRRGLAAAGHRAYRCSSTCGRPARRRARPRRAQLLLHCGPPIELADVCDPLRRSMRAAIVRRGLGRRRRRSRRAAGRRRGPARAGQRARRRGPDGHASMGPTTPVWVVELPRRRHCRAFAPLNQGPGDVAVVRPRHRRRRRAAGVPARGGRRRCSPRPCAAVRARRRPSLAAQGVAMGDDVHVRTQAATNLLLRTCCRGSWPREHPRRVEVARFLSAPLGLAGVVEAAGIRHRYIQPRGPSRTGKLSAAIGSIHEEFWSRHDFGDFARAADALRQWEHAYNHECSSLCRAVHPSRSSRPYPSHLQPQHRRNDHTNRRLTHGKWPVLTRRNAGARARREIRRLERWGCSGTGTCTVTLNGTMIVTASFSTRVRMNSVSILGPLS